MSTLGTTARRLREEMKLTQVEPGQRTELGETWVKRLEAGHLHHVDYMLVSLRRVAAALGYSLPAFLREAGIFNAEDLNVDTAPEITQLTADLHHLSLTEHESVKQLVVLLARKGSTSA